MVDDDGLGYEAVSQVSSDGESSDFRWCVTPCRCHVVADPSLPGIGLGRIVRDGTGTPHWTNRKSTAELLGEGAYCGAHVELVMETCQAAEDEMVKAFSS